MDLQEGAAHSLFTAHLLAGLQGEANGAGGVIRIFDLFDYVQQKVVAARKDQHPIFKAEIEENFPVALYQGGQKKAISPALPLSDGYAYDFFLSYSGTQADRLWIRTHLLPALEAHGLRVAVDFRGRLDYPRLNLVNRLYKPAAILYQSSPKRTCKVAWVNLKILSLNTWVTKIATIDLSPF